MSPLYDEHRDRGGPPTTTDAGAIDPKSPGSEEYFNSWFRDGNYKSHPAFTKVTSAPYPSAVTAGSKIEVYVTGPLDGPYSRISPDRSGSNAVMVPRTIIVREVLDANGKLTKITVMAKGLDGYNPALGDWYFGEFDPRGNVLLDAKGKPRTGKLTDCYGCHLPRAKDAYLFGVPDSARAR
ncbi:cytochrome P460 family protein [Pendulispora brunnea]|uniref:Cytochrome P460 family protein n=1 Tax=Pendulispora brunnea TaxID=2905690 RepID=A0ABZ2JVF7_9BACT